MFDPDDHYNPSVRLLEIERRSSSLGFHLTRSKWDPYPWVSGVDLDTPAYYAGIKPGDCILEINGEDVVGQRISEIAEMVKSRDNVALLLWNAGVNPKCGPEALCCGPMPANMHRLSACMNSIIQSLECPICLNTVSPPSCQCVNGHLFCVKCHAKSEKCPICRVRMTRGRCLFADQVFGAIIDAFELSKETTDKERINKIQQIFKQKKKKKSIPDIKVTQLYATKFLSRLAEKSSSAENLNDNSQPRIFLSVPDEFSSNLKTKSLSDYDISSSPTNSRFNSRFNINFQNTSSCNGSFESLNNENNKIDIDNNLYYCPFDQDCIERIIPMNVIKHFQEEHDGPLIQYFKSKNTFKLLDKHFNTYCFIFEEKTFFLRIHKIEEEMKEYQKGLLIWMWLLADQKIANEYQLQVNLNVSENPENVLLSFTSAINSLAYISWKNIIESQRGLFISLETIKALSNNSGNMNIEIEINNCNNDSKTMTRL